MHLSVHNSHHNQVCFLLIKMIILVVFGLCLWQPLTPWIFDDVFLFVNCFHKIISGHAFNQEDRCVCAGYDNGDVKLFDLRNMSVRWETNIKNGVNWWLIINGLWIGLRSDCDHVGLHGSQVCCVEFDRKDINMNKLVATSLEGRFHVFDMRTQHPTKGFASVSEKVINLWGLDPKRDDIPLKTAVISVNRSVLLQMSWSSLCSQRSCKYLFLCSAGRSALGLMVLPKSMIYFKQKWIFNSQTLHFLE